MLKGEDGRPKQKELFSKDTKKITRIKKRENEAYDKRVAFLSTQTNADDKGIKGKEKNRTTQKTRSSENNHEKRDQNI